MPNPPLWLSLVLYYTGPAERADSTAQFQIAELWNVHGKSHTLARHWYRRAAESGHPEAAAKLARILLGDSPPNFELAYRWSLIAVERGNRDGYELSKVAGRYLTLSRQAEIVKELCDRRTPPKQSADQGTEKD